MSFVCPKPCRIAWCNWHQSQPENSSLLTRSQRIEHSDSTILGEVLLWHAALVGPEPALIILDDYQNLAGASEVDDLLAALIDGSPPSLRFSHSLTHYSSISPWLA